MGVTIHYSGTLANAADAGAFLKEASALANELKWEFTTSDTPNPSITMSPHPDCEPFAFDPDKNGTVENWVKTQFAGPEIHIQILGFLSRIAPFFNALSVEDEAEFWETQDRAALDGHFNQINAVLRDMMEENPNARSQLRMPSGRIVDITA